VKGVALLNPTPSPEKHRFWVRADPVRSGAGHAGGAQETSTNRPPGVSDGIECRLSGPHLGAGQQPGERRARALGATRKAVPEYANRCQKRCANGRVASDGDRYAATVSDEEG